MARIKVTLNRGEVGLLLRTAFGPELEAAAGLIAERAGRRGHPRDVRVHRYTTDRQVVAVSVPAYRQARYGALSKAAAAVGLTVRGNL
ncbi:hypothetical protein [Nocardia arizonensis]|uniref:hypothetical protein n=1 Tax=Nocardia arizonensis TaxID=1141647 RepID=UPI0006D1635D|nr:hypothetical protein [Nocardia arizonensis]